MTSKYISNVELGRFNLFYRPTQEPVPDYLHLDSLPRLDEVFNHPDVFYTFVFINYPGQKVGHWCLLIKIDDHTFEWFDCLAKPTPQILIDRLNEYANEHDVVVRLSTMKEAVMSRKNWICGKWCMLRVATLPHSPEVFQDALTKFRKVMPLDEIPDLFMNFRI